MKIAINGSRHQEEHLGEISEFLRRLHRSGDEVVMHRRLYTYLQRLIPLDMAAVTRVTDAADFKADLVVSLGGDGTFLRTAMWVADKELPIVGVNTGHLGYLSAVPVAQLPDLPARLDSLQLQARSLIHIDGLPEGAPWPYALNEVTFTRDDSATMIEVHASLDGHPLAIYRGDGLIVATPTGSTAYNLSVGGPIMQPQAPVLAISPIATHSLTLRPLVVSDASQIDVSVQARAHAFRVTVDGRVASMPVGSRLTLRRAPFVTNIYMPADQTFATTLRDKLNWGASEV